MKKARGATRAFSDTSSAFPDAFDVISISFRCLPVNNR